MTILRLTLLGVFLTTLRETWFPTDEVITNDGSVRTDDERGQSLTKIMELLAKSTDAQIRCITDPHCGLLENSTETFMEPFLNENVFSESEYEAIRTPDESLPRSDFSRLIIDTMLGKGAHGERKMWALLHKLQESKHKATWPEMENSNAKILQMLEGCTDAQLHRITFSYRQELEQSIEEFVEVLSHLLAHAKVLTEDDHKKITSLAESHSYYEASKLSLDVLLEKNATDERVMWSILFELQKYKPKLQNTLLAIESTGVGWWKMLSETSDAKLSLMLSRHTDIELHRLIGLYRQKLAQSMEKILNLEAVSQSLLNAKVFTETDHEEICTLAGSNQKNAASQIFLEAVLESGPIGPRTMCNTFAELQICSRELKEILSEGREKGSEFLTGSVRNEMNREVKIYVQGFKHKKYIREKNKRLRVLVTGEKECHGIYLLAQCYTNIVIVARPREWEEVECELKSSGRMRAETLSKYINKHETYGLHELFPSTCCKTRQTSTTMVIGAAGIGKSTLIQKMILDWASGEIYKQFAFVFYFNFSFLNFTNGRTSLSNLIMDFYPHFDYQLEHLWQEPSKLLFVFDDFEQFEKKNIFGNAKSNVDQQNHYLDPECYCDVSEIVRCLIQGNLLTGCSVLITTRPWKLEILAKAKIDQTVEILGFQPDQFKEYFRQFYGDQQFMRDVTEYIEQNETLYTMYYNPLYCSALNSLLALHLTQGSDRASPFRMTSTRVFFAYVTGLLERCGCNRVIAAKNLLQLGEMAYKGICNQNIVFHSEQLNHQEHGLSNIIPAFMLEIRDEYRGSLVYTFTHSILQDFVAALMIRQRTAGNQLIRLISEWNTCTDDRFNICARFLVGLSSRNLTDQLGSQMVEISTETASAVSDWLNENVKRLIPNMEDGKVQSSLLTMFYYLFEFGDTEVMAAALKPLKTITFRKFPLKYSDCVVLSTVLMYAEQMEELNLAACCIEADGIHQLELLLSKCKVLRLNDNKLGDSGLKWIIAVLKRIDCKVQRLELKSNGLTDGCVEMLVSSLSTNCSLVELDLSNDNLDSEQANRLTDKSVPALKDLMQSRAYLKEIGLRGNQFSEEGRKTLISDNVSVHLTVITE